MPQQDHLTARLVVDDDFEVAPVNNRLFGSFVEHLGRCVYTGIYEPDHPTAEFEIRLQDGAQPASVEAQTLHDDDLFAANTLYDQNRVTPHANGSAMYDAESGVVRVSLPPVSWTALHIK